MALAHKVSQSGPHLALPRSEIRGETNEIAAVVVVGAVVAIYSMTTTGERLKPAIQ